MILVICKYNLLMIVINYSHSTKCSVDVIEGPSTRGFELFSRSPVRKVEKVDHSVLNKHKDDMEQLDLTLSLPNVLNFPMMMINMLCVCVCVCVYIYIL